MHDARKRLEALRARIQELDRELLELIAERRRLVQEIGGVKRTLGLPVLDPAREAEVVRRAATLARDQGVDEELIRDLLWRIIASARGSQHEDAAAPPEGARREGKADG